MLRIVIILAALISLSACTSFNLFSPPKIKQEEIIAPDVLYQSALDDMDRQYFQTALKTLAKLERQHPTSEYAEKAKLMTVYANFRIGRYNDAILAADRYLALYPNSKEVPYILYLKGNSYYAQIKDITRDQQLAQDAIDTLQMLIAGYPKSKYVEEAKKSIRVANDQLAGKEMSVGRYYLGNKEYSAALNRFRVVVDKYQTSTHIEEALYRLVETYLALGLINEARTAAAVLGHNYSASQWYESAYNLLQQQGVTPKMMDENLFKQTSGS